MALPEQTFQDQHDRDRIRALSRSQLESRQLSILNAILPRIRQENPFYRQKFAGSPLQLESLQQFSEFPLTEKDDLVGDRLDGIATNHSHPPEHYVRCHRTSGTKGQPMVVMDTAEDWQAWLRTWQYVLDAAGLQSHDKVFMAFSFGPFIGFWSAFDACIARGNMVIPGGGLSSLARFELLKSLAASVLFCTPTYALHLAEVALRHNESPRTTAVQKIIVAGEPGGSVPGIRNKIEKLWDADVIDHAGATEIGPWGVGDAHGEHLRIIESDYLAEFLSVENVDSNQDPSLRELVLTSLTRMSTPILRYRTGDLVRPKLPEQDDVCQFMQLAGGILGRRDDMIIVRGVNIFPSSIESILRSCDSVQEYRITATRDEAMDQLSIEIEDLNHNPNHIADVVRKRLGLRVEVLEVPLNSLPRFDAKGKRFVDKRLVH